MSALPNFPYRVTDVIPFSMRSPYRPPDGRFGAMVMVELVESSQPPPQDRDPLKFTVPIRLRSVLSGGPKAQLQQRIGRAIMVKLVGSTGEKTEVIVYDRPLVGNFTDKNIWADASAQSVTTASQFCAFQFLHGQLRQLFALHHPRAITIPRDVDLQRFPRLQCVLDWDTVSKLQVGSVIGAPVGPHLQLGYDAELAKLGFAADEAGNNALTDYGRRGFSFPIRFPGELLRGKLPPVLEFLSPWRAISEGNYNAHVTLLEGHELTELEEAGPAPVTTGQSCGAGSRRTVSANCKQPQPCYSRRGAEVMMVGNFKIFTIDQGGYRLYLVDSPDPSKETAIYAFASKDDAVAHARARGVGSVKELRRKHHSEGWREAMPAWLDDLFASKKSSLQRTPPAAPNAAALPVV